MNQGEGVGREGALTYEPVGATRGELPAGFDHLRHSRVVGRGRPQLETAARAVLGWQAQDLLGSRVQPGDRPAAEGDVVGVRLGLGPWALRAPARVLYVVDQPDRRGFAYGTLPGHPLSGEEAFVVHLEPDGLVVFTVTAYSRPAWPLVRAAGPLLPLFQQVMARRYARAIARAVRQAHRAG